MRAIEFPLTLHPGEVLDGIPLKAPYTLTLTVLERITFETEKEFQEYLSQEYPSAIKLEISDKPS
jgi:hypothetical protein